MQQRPFTLGSITLRNPFIDPTLHQSNHNKTNFTKTTSFKSPHSAKLLRLIFFLTFSLSLFLLFTSFSYRRPPSSQPPPPKALYPPPPSPPLRILHIVTSLIEFQTGTRGTTQGVSRLNTILTPTLLTTVESILSYKPIDTNINNEHYELSVHVILGYTLTAEQEKALTQEVINKGARAITFTYDAVPYGITNEGEKVKLLRSLARQHRYIVKECLNDFDFFSAWEDDMLVTAGHVANFRVNSKKLEKVESDVGWVDEGVMIPGFLRVEVLDEHGKLDRLLGDVEKYGGVGGEVDTGICCGSYVPPINKNTATSAPLLSDPKRRSHLLLLWESSIASYKLTLLPTINEIVALLPITDTSKYKSKHKRLLKNSVWAYDEDKSKGFIDGYREKTSLFGQQAGWMLSADQIRRIHNSCLIDGHGSDPTSTTPPKTFEGKGFLPEFSGWKDNGAWLNVEFWSGGYQIFGTACQVQRVIFIGVGYELVTQGDEFGAQLIWHTGNNKQRIKTGAWVTEGYVSFFEMRFSGVDFGGVSGGGGVIGDLKRRGKELIEAGFGKSGKS